MKIQEKIIEMQEAAIAQKKEAIVIGNGKASDILCYMIDQVTAIQIACLLATGEQEAGGIVPDSGAIANETGPEMIIPITNDNIIDLIIKENT